MRSSKIPFIILLIIMIEIALFILVGEAIGVALTLVLVVVTSVIGSILLRIQGMSVVKQVQAEIQSQGKPGAPLIHGFMIMVAGMLLLIPGFLTDFIGFMLFIPPVRTGLWKLLGRDLVVTGASTAYTQSSPHWNDHTSRAKSSQGEKIIELDEDEFERKDHSSSSDSPWSKP